MFSKQDKISFFCVGVLILWGIGFNAYHLYIEDSDADLLVFNMILSVYLIAQVVLGYSAYLKLIKHLKQYVMEK